MNGEVLWFGIPTLHIWVIDVGLQTVQDFLDLVARSCAWAGCGIRNTVLGLLFLFCVLGYIARFRTVEHLQFSADVW